jgi:hypothetical protein
MNVIFLICGVLCITIGTLMLLKFFKNDIPYNPFIFTIRTILFAGIILVVYGIGVTVHYFCLIFHIYSYR